MDQVLDPASRALWRGCNSKGPRGGIGLNGDTTFNQADHYCDQENHGKRGESTNYPAGKGKKRCIYRGFIRGPTGFVPNLGVRWPLGGNWLVSSTAGSTRIFL